MVRFYGIYRSSIFMVSTLSTIILPHGYKERNENIHIQRNGYDTGNFVGGFAAQVISMTDAVMSSGLTIIPFTTAGIVHNNTAGLFSSSLIIDADVDPAAAIVDTKLATISTAGKVANSATTATNANTANAIVKRDASGNFSAGTITANLNGNATTATASTNFSGSLVGDVTGTQGATVVSAVGGQTAANVAAATVLVNAATNTNTASTIVKRDASGNFSTNMITLAGTTTNSTDAATKAYVDSTAGGTSLNTSNTVVRRDGTGSFAAQIISLVDAVASGNIVLSTNPSSSTSGNILKGANRFIHNFGTSNTFVGENSGNFSMSGTGQNVAIGANALNANTTGNNNIAIGFGAGNNITTGSGNILINATAGTATESNAIRIGTAQSTCFIQGISGSGLLSAATVVVNGSGQLGVLLSSEKYKHNIQDMGELSSRIHILRPVTFVYNSDKNNLSQYGLIAEEVEKVFPELIVYDENGLPQTVQYHVLPVLLLNELQKLVARVAALEACRY